MQTDRRLFLLFLTFSFLAVLSLPVFAQQVIATVPVGSYPQSSAVNPVTNKIYVANYCGTDPTCASQGTVTVIDGATDNTQSVNVGFYPVVVAVDPVTNTIYVVNNNCIDYPNPCAGNGTVTVIDGVTLATNTVTVGSYPYGIAVNPMTNQIYVANVCGNDVTCSTYSGTVTVIDGVTLGATTVPVGANPYAPVVNSVTNQIYVPNACGNDPTCASPHGPGTVTVIDGATDSTVSSAIIWIARSVTPPLPWPRLMLMSCASAGAASDPAAISVEKNRTLRGADADLTKGSLDGPAGMPSRLPDSQTRSSPRAPQPAGRSGARCGRPRGQGAVRG